MELKPGFSPSLSILLFTLASLLLLTCVPETDSALKFLTWGETCVLPKLGEFSKPSDGECNISKGLLCQAYTQGTYCGCPIVGSLSWDRQSGECRRKVTLQCAYDNENEEWRGLPFVSKCHERATCSLMNVTALTGKRANEDVRICLCKPEFQASRDFSECTDPNGRTASVASARDMANLMVLMMGFIYICRII